MKTFLDYLYEMPNSTQLDQIAVQTINAEPSFSWLLLVFTFFVVSLGGIARQRLKSGYADYPMWFTVGSLSTLMISMIMSLVEGFINIVYISVVITVTFFSGVWLFLDKRSTEI